MTLRHLRQCTHRVSSRGNKGTTTYQHFSTAPNRALVICIIFLFLPPVYPLCQSALWATLSHPGLSSGPGATSPPASVAGESTVGMEENKRIQFRKVVIFRCMNCITIWIRCHDEPCYCTRYSDWAVGAMIRSSSTYWGKRRFFSPKMFRPALGPICFTVGWVPNFKPP